MIHENNKQKIRKTNTLYTPFGDYDCILCLQQFVMVRIVTLLDADSSMFCFVNYFYVL